MTMADQIKAAEVSYSLGDFPESQAILLDLLSRYPANSKALIKLGRIALWNNQNDQALAYFNRALQNSVLAGKIWPLNIELNTLMAEAHSREDRMSESAKFYAAASGPGGIGLIKSLKVKARQFSLFDGLLPYEIKGDDIAELDFIILDPLPVVKLSVNGSEQANFVIDTGGDDIHLDKAFAERVGAEVVGELPVSAGYAAGEKGSVKYGKVDSLNTGGITVHHIPVGISDFQPISSLVFDKMPISGLIGTRFLMRFLSTIDYKNRKLVLRQRNDKNQQKLARQIHCSKSKTVPFYLAFTHLILAQGAFNKKNQGLYLIDTGLADAGFMSSRKRLLASGVKIDSNNSFTGAGLGGMAEGFQVEIDEVLLGSVENKIIGRNIKAVVLEKELLLLDGDLGFKVNGLISHQFFHNYAVTFDFEKMRLVLQ